MKEDCENCYCVEVDGKSIVFIKNDNNASKKVIFGVVFARLGDIYYIGDVEIADGVVIGANAVVTKSCLESNVTIAGCPARIIINRGSEDYVD